MISLADPTDYVQFAATGNIVSGSTERRSSRRRCAHDDLANVDSPWESTPRARRIHGLTYPCFGREMHSHAAIPKIRNEPKPRAVTVRFANPGTRDPSFKIDRGQSLLVAEITLAGAVECWIRIGVFTCSVHCTRGPAMWPHWPTYTAVAFAAGIVSPCADTAPQIH
jgi:hypothetical protein